MVVVVAKERRIHFNESIPKSLQVGGIKLKVRVRDGPVVSVFGPVIMGTVGITSVVPVSDIVGERLNE